MKKVVLSVIVAFLSKMIIAQIPQGFNYQAIARDGSGNPVTNATIKVKLSILTDTTGFYLSGSGTYLWEEEQTNIKTNAFGLFTVVLGDPLAIKSQGTSASFSAIDWAKTPLYIGTKIANPTDYKNLGAAKLWSVPYSMVADSTKALLKGSKLSVVSDNDVSSDALFEVKRKDGQTVFAVYPDAVNIYIPKGIKGTKGGFAIGGFDGSKTDPQDYFRVTRDSVRIYIDNTPKTTKGATKGGFAIGGFDQVKGGVQDLLTVSNDSIRMYINDVLGKGATKGGFAIGGFTESKGIKSRFFNITPDSVRIYVNEPTSTSNIQGFKIGERNILTNLHNHYLNLGRYTSKIISKSTSFDTQEFTSWNLVIPNTKGNDTIKLLRASFANLSMTIPFGGNPVKGEGAKFEVKTNESVKGLEGKLISIGRENVGVGTGAGVIFNGNKNILIGNSENANTLFNGQYDVVIGDYSFTGSSDPFTNYNVLIGSGMKVTGSYNICIGNQAGNNRISGESNKLYIDISNTATPLIFGDFQSRSLFFNGKVGIGTKGSLINNIIKVTRTKDIPSIAANTSSIQDFTVPDAVSNSSVSISPNSELPDGLIISYARVSSNGNVSVKFRNVTGSAIDPDSMDFFITVIE